MTCAHCHREIGSPVSLEEMEREYQELFPDFPNEERAVICDECFQKLMASNVARKRPYN